MGGDGEWEEPEAHPDRQRLVLSAELLFPGCTDGSLWVPCALHMICTRGCGVCNMHIQESEQWGEAMLDADVGPVAEGGFFLLRECLETSTLEHCPEEIAQSVVTHCRIPTACVDMMSLAVHTCSTTGTPGASARDRHTETKAYSQLHVCVAQG